MCVCWILVRGGGGGGREQRAGRVGGRRPWPCPASSNLGEGSCEPRLCLLQLLAGFMQRRGGGQRKKEEEKRKEGGRGREAENNRFSPISLQHPALHSHPAVWGALAGGGHWDFLSEQFGIFLFGEPHAALGARRRRRAGGGGCSMLGKGAAGKPGDLAGLRHTPKLHPL